MRVEAFYSVPPRRTLAGPLAASAATASGAGALQISFVEIDGEECYDLLRGGASSAWRSRCRKRRDARCRLRAASLRSLEDCAYALRLGLRASQRGVLAPRTHTILTLSVRTEKDRDVTEGDASFGSEAASKEARLVLVDLASGELHGQHRYRLSQAPPQTPPAGVWPSSARALRRAQRAVRIIRAYHGRSRSCLSFSRRCLLGEFCTAILGCCGAAEADTQATISTLHFLLATGRLSNRVRVPQPPLESLLRRLRSLEERLSIQQQRWLEANRRLRQRQGGCRAPCPYRRRGGIEDLGPQQESELFRELAAQLGLINSQRSEQTAHLRAHCRDLRAAIGEAGKQRRALPWHEGPVLSGLSSAKEVMMRLEQAEQMQRQLRSSKEKGRRRTRRCCMSSICSQVE